MTDSIFLLAEDGDLKALEQTGYVSEDRLQALLAAYPHLLAGEQIDLQEPRQWILVSREVAVPGHADGGGRWSVDHLFLDQDGIPTFVEVKRSTDTRIRREVIGQLLEYAANALSYWAPDFIRLRYEGTRRESRLDPEPHLAEALGLGLDYEAYWDQVKTNLQAGRVRLLVVGDRIPNELRHIVEFLNEQMNPAQILAVEIKRYAGAGVSTLVPRVLGHTAAAQQAKGSSRPARAWDEASFFKELSEQAPLDVPTARAVLGWASERKLEVWWGKGSRNGSFSPRRTLDSTTHQLFAVWTTGFLEIYFQWHAGKPPFSDPRLREELRNRLRAIPGLDFDDADLIKRPSFPLHLIRSESAFAHFSAAFDWFLEVLGEY